MYVIIANVLYVRPLARPLKAGARAVKLILNWGRPREIGKNSFLGKFGKTELSIPGIIDWGVVLLRFFFGCSSWTRGTFREQKWVHNSLLQIIYVHGDMHGFIRNSLPYLLHPWMR